VFGVGHNIVAVEGRRPIRLDEKVPELGVVRLFWGLEQLEDACRRKG
jgi:hypothetical protein